VERWLCGVAASREQWPEDRYTFQLPCTGLPVHIDHQDLWACSSGMVPGDVGAARRFAEVGGLGVVCLIEIAADHPAVLWDVAEGRRKGLSVTAHPVEPPGGGLEWVYFSEVSLTSTPRDPLARIVSSGQLALDNWRILARVRPWARRGEQTAGADGVPCPAAVSFRARAGVSLAVRACSRRTWRPTRTGRRCEPGTVLLTGVARPGARTRCRVPDTR